MLTTTILRIFNAISKELSNAINLWSVENFEIFEFIKY